MERAPRVQVVEARLRWSDVGSFRALDAVSPPDADGNVAVLSGGARAWLQQAEDCIVYGEGPRAVTLFGVDDLVVVAVDDAVLVAPRDRIDDLKQVIERMRAGGWTDLL